MTMGSTKDIVKGVMLIYAINLTTITYATVVGPVDVIIQNWPKYETTSAGVSVARRGRRVFLLATRAAEGCRVLVAMAVSTLPSCGASCPW